MALQVGSRIAHYDVTALIGEGGMGQVYQATDTKLNRQVALKILPEAFAADPDRLARFQREAQVLASLNHPNIAQIHGIEEEEGTRALVLELVEGPTLADRISKGPIPVDEALPIAKQIAEALEAAHEAGVIHRDLKPANIKVREDGTVKVLDFGLAKALDPNPTGDPSQSPTLTAAATQMGVIMGTAAYMSPEQASGSPVDKRADIWSFGVVLFEMLTGQRIFAGETVSHVLGAVLQVEPTWDALPTTTPQPLRRLLRRCLEKGQKRRLRDVGEAVAHLEEAAAPSSVEPSVVPAVAPRTGGWRRAVPFVGALIVTSLLTGLAVWIVMQPEPPRIARFAISPDDAPSLFIAQTSPDVAISPDGEHIAYLTGSVGLGAERLHVRPLDQLESETLVAEGELNSPFFAPDGESVGFYDRSVQPPVLKRVSVLGGPPATICELQGDLRGASWGADGTIVFASAELASGVWSVAAVGGEPEQLTTPDTSAGEVDHYWPEVLPGGEAVLFSVLRTSVEDSEIAVLSLTTGEQKAVIRGGAFPRYSPTGHLVYGVQGNLWAVRFDLSRLETVGDAVPVQEGVLTKGFGTTNFGVSQNGSLVYVPGVAGPGGGRTLVWVDRQGREESVAGFPTGDYRNPGISPDGQYVTFDDGQDVWTFDFTRQTMTRITTAPEVDSHPLWTTDGQQIIFSSLRDEGGAGLYARVADGTGDAEQLTQETGPAQPTGWGPEGVTGVFHAPGNARDIGTFSLDGSGEPEMLIDSEFNEAWSVVSPNGRWIAYSSNPTGALEVYVERFPELGERRQISTGGGDFPRWSPDGDELFYRSGGATFQVWAVSVGSGDDLSPGIPELLFESAAYLNQGGNRMYDVASGDRFLISALASAVPEGPPDSHLVLVQNWFEELKRLVPTP